MLPAKIMLAFHFWWFDWHDMVTKVPVPSASGITNVPPPNFFSILQNLRFGVFTLLPEYPLRYCCFTASAGGRNHGGGRVQALIGEETGEKSRCGKQNAGGIKTGGGGMFVIPDAKGTCTFVNMSCQSNHMKWNASMILA